MSGMQPIAQGMEVVVTAPIDEDVTKKDIFADWSLRKAGKLEG